jgi:hypothetical protein
LIDLIIAQHPASSISAIFRTKTSSIMYKNYIEKREGMGEAGQKLYRKEGRDG